jgi:hypothetical protein
VNCTTRVSAIISASAKRFSDCNNSAEGKHEDVESAKCIGLEILSAACRKRETRHLSLKRGRPITPPCCRS